MNQRGRTLLGALFIIAGGLIVLDLFNILPGGTAAIWAAVFLAAGLGFLYFYLTDKTSFWWAIIPAFAILGIALILVLSLVFPAAAGELGGSIVLLGLASGFWIVFLRDRSNWWPIVPAGVLTSLGILIALSNVFPGEVFAGSFMIGIGLTFILVYFAQDREQRQPWALYPGGIMMGIGLILIIASTTSWLLLLPALLIIAGVILIYRVVRETRAAP